MKYVDRLLQRWRMRKCIRHISPDARVIDIGAHEGELFRELGANLKAGFGVEPLCQKVLQAANYVIHPGYFPAVRPAEGPWDAITMLAVLEHIPREQEGAMADACHELLREGGRVIITVPTAAVDHILAMLRFLRLIDGMSLEEHFGFDPAETPRIFAAPGFRLVRHERFQLGLNHLYVFEKTLAP